MYQDFCSATEFASLQKSGVSLRHGGSGVTETGTPESGYRSPGHMTVRENGAAGEASADGHLFVYTPESGAPEPRARVDDAESGIIIKNDNSGRKKLGTLTSERSALEDGHDDRHRNKDEHDDSNDDLGQPLRTTTFGTRASAMPKGGPALSFNRRAAPAELPT